MHTHIHKHRPFWILLFGVNYEKMNKVAKTEYTEKNEKNKVAEVTKLLEANNLGTEKLTDVLDRYGKSKRWEL